MTLIDDSTIVSAVINLPSLALPPIGGLIVLLFGYILLVGPVNYLVLRRLDRREWAWVTVPVLILVFTVGSFGIGGLLRGSDVIIHEVGDRPRRTRDDRGHGPVLPRDLQPVAGHLPGPGPRRCAASPPHER